MRSMSFYGISARVNLGSRHEVPRGECPSSYLIGLIQVCLDDLYALNGTQINHEKEDFRCLGVLHRLRHRRRREMAGSDCDRQPRASVGVPGHVRGAAATPRGLTDAGAPTPTSSYQTAHRNSPPCVGQLYRRHGKLTTIPSSQTLCVA